MDSFLAFSRNIRSAWAGVIDLHPQQKHQQSVRKHENVHLSHVFSESNTSSIIIVSSSPLNLPFSVSLLLSHDELCNVTPG